MDLINRFSREMGSMREYQVVILGASGFTGAFIVRNLAKSIAKDKLSIKWAVAGRNRTKVKAVLEEGTTISGIDLQSIAILEADVNDVNSLKEMAKKAKLVLNCVGPYRLYGEPVLKACLVEGTHYLDLCGEPQYMEEMQLKYHQEAEKKGVYMVSACGWDSIPCDLGINFLRDKFEGTLNSVETFLVIKRVTTANSATWDALVDGVYHQKELKDLRRRLFPHVFGEAAKYKSSHRLKERSFFKYNGTDGSGWCVPFPGSDRSVARRSQLHNLIYYKENPADINTFMVIPLMTIFMGLVPMLMFNVLLPFKFGRYLLHRFPAFFSFGMFKTSGPSVEETNTLRFILNLVGKGWVEGTDVTQVPPNKILTAQVEGPHPGYPATAICMVQSALTLLEETNSMPNKGGVLTPGAAFRKTTLVERLKQNGLNITLPTNC